MRFLKGYVYFMSAILPINISNPAFKATSKKAGNNADSTKNTQKPIKTHAGLITGLISSGGLNGFVTYKLYKSYIEDKNLYDLIPEKKEAQIREFAEICTGKHKGDIDYFTRNFNKALILDYLKTMGIGSLAFLIPIVTIGLITDLATNKSISKKINKQQNSNNTLSIDNQIQQ